MNSATAASFSLAATCRKIRSDRVSKAASRNVSDTQAPIPSLADRVRPVSAGAPVVGVHFLGQTPVFVLGEEALLFAENSERRVNAHAGAILSSASDGERIITGGDDGTLIGTRASSTSLPLASQDKKNSVDHDALRPVGAVGWMAGKNAE